MIVQCKDCRKWFEDVYRNCNCPHYPFPANDGKNNFNIHYDSYLNDQEPEPSRVFEAHKNDKTK